MDFWDAFNKWVENIIFPKSDTPERRFQKKIAMHQILASGIIAVGSSLIAMGLVFYSFGLSLIPQLVSEIEGKEETSVAYQEFINSALKRADSIIGIGFAVLILGIIYAIAEIIREK
jgi:hypothetical protein